MSEHTSVPSINAPASVRMSPKRTYVDVPVCYTVKVPVEDWIDIITTNDEPFRRSACGYWLRGVVWENPDGIEAEHQGRGWLCWENENEDRVRFGEEPDHDAAVEAWKAGLTLPKCWYRLDVQAAKAAYVEGCKRWGEDWHMGDHGDATGMDICIQLALLGDVKYG